MKRALLFALSVLVASSVFAASKKPTGTCTAISFSPTAGGDFSASIKVTEITDVDVWVLFDPQTRAKWKDLHTLSVRLYTPNGFLYQTLDIPFTTDENKKGKDAALSGYPSEKQFVVLKDKTYKGNKHLGANVSIPLAGTDIMTSGVYGLWHVEALVDNEPSSCTTAAAVLITP